MPRKSTAPYAGPPSWLDADAERPLAASERYEKPEFIRRCMTAFIREGCSPLMAADAAANAMGEAAWGHACWHGNAGGWKITREYATAFKVLKGTSAPWWKARGNVDSGDAPWCFYRAFDSLDAFLVEWLAHYVPKPGANAPYPRYRKAGERFWAGDARWFGDLILAGYKGAPSKLRMVALRAVGANDARHPSVRAHASIADEVTEVWAQLVLGIDPDGAWGPKSRASLCAWQIAHGLPATGELYDATVDTLREAPAAS